MQSANKNASVKWRGAVAEFKSTDRTSVTLMTKRFKKVNLTMERGDWISKGRTWWRNLCFNSNGSIVLRIHRRIECRFSLWFSSTICPKNFIRFCLCQLTNVMVSFGNFMNQCIFQYVFFFFFETLMTIYFFKKLHRVITETESSQHA